MFFEPTRKIIINHKPMKTQKLVFLLGLAGILSVGCTKQYVTRQITEQTIIQGSVIEMADAEVKASDWSNKGEYFEALIKVDKITRDVVKEGTVQVNRKDVDGANKVFWTPLPAMSTSYVQDQGQDVYYTTFTDFQWSEGYVSIFVTTTDLYTGDNPGDQSFRIIVQM